MKFISKETGVLLKEKTRIPLFEKMKEKFGSHKNAAMFLDVKKATYSSWKLGKNRVPINTLNKMADASGIEKREICSDVVSTDRMICSLA